MTDFIEYPRWIYHATEPARIIQTPEEWADNWFASAEEALASVDPRTVLIQKAEELGAVIDKRWTADKIQAAIDEVSARDNPGSTDQSGAQTG